MIKRIGALGLASLLAFASISFTSTMASAAPASASLKMSSTIEMIDQRIKAKFEQDMRNDYAKEKGVDDMSLITSSGDSECINGSAVIKKDGYTEYFSLTYCFGSTYSSYYGAGEYDYAYVNDYVIDEEWNAVYDFWTNVDISGLDVKGREFTLQDAYYEVSFTEVPKAPTRKTRSLYLDDGGKDDFYLQRSRGTYVSATVSGFEFYLDGEPTALIRRNKNRYSETCVETEPGYCGGGGKGITVGSSGGGSKKP